MGFENAYFRMRMGKVISSERSLRIYQITKENCKYPVIYLNPREKSVNTFGILHDEEVLNLLVTNC